MRYDKRVKELWAEILKVLYACQSGHPGGSLSCVETLMALYYEAMKVDPKSPKDPDRDRFVLSKGHACPTPYAALADLGYSPKEDLAGLRQTDSHLQGYPDCTKTLGVNMDTDSPRQGAPLAMGLALAAKHAGVDCKAYTVLGDGEYQEGLVWEAAAAAVHYKLDNLILMLDYNKPQVDGRKDEVMSLGNIMRRFNALDFECFEVDGHDMDVTVTALKTPVSGRPKFICCNTVGGKGIFFMEDQLGWHGSPMNKEQLEKASSEQEVEQNGKVITCCVR